MNFASQKVLPAGLLISHLLMGLKVLDQLCLPHRAQPQHILPQPPRRIGLGLMGIQTLCFTWMGLTHPQLLLMILARRGRPRVMRKSTPHKVNLAEPPDYLMAQGIGSTHPIAKTSTLDRATLRLISGLEKMPTQLYKLRMGRQTQPQQPLL